MRSRFVRPPWLLALLALTACGSEQEPAAGGQGGSAGAAPLALEVYPGNFLEEDQPLVMLADGDPARLMLAVQGGWVIYIGAQVKNLNGDQADIVARLIDPGTGAVRKEDARTIVMKPVEGQPDLKQPDLRSRSQVAHLWVCPNQEARDIAGQEWIIEVEISSTDGAQTGKRSVRVLASCEQGDPTQTAQCTCECTAGYVLGTCG